MLAAKQTVEVSPAIGELQQLPAAAHLDSGSLFPGLHLELAEIWRA